MKESSKSQSAGFSTGIFPCGVWNSCSGCKMALFILAELNVERSCPTSSQLCTPSHHGLAQLASWVALGNGRVGLTPLPVPVISLSSPSWESAHRAGGDVLDRDKTQAALQICWRVDVRSSRSPGAVSCKLKHSSLWLIVPFTEVRT